MKIMTAIGRMSPITVLTFGYIAIILLSALVLALPFSSSNGGFTSYLDSLFTATSAITTTGLIVFDTGTYYNLFGQTLIMILTQIGGLGYMLFAILVFIAFKQTISVQSNLMFQETVRRPSKVDLFYFAKIILLFTITIELIGAIILSILFSRHLPLDQSLYSGIFHSISAFNTAGFSIFYDSFSAYHDHLAINMVLIFISTLGSLGFFVLYDVIYFSRERLSGVKNGKLSIHSRLVLICTAVMLVSGTILFFLNESWPGDMTLGHKALSSLFQCSSASTTTGFNSMDIGKIHRSNLFLMIIMMFVGAGSGGTAGGIKVTTLCVTILSVYAIIRSRKNVNVFKRRLPFDVIRNSLAIVVLSLSWTIAATYILAVVEKYEFIALLFEVTSALGTVGLSTGITPGLSGPGKIVVILSMFIGRIGPLGIGISLFKRVNGPHYRYATTDIFIG